jgi:hypothetical protein
MKDEDKKTFHQQAKSMREEFERDKKEKLLASKK